MIGEKLDTPTGPAPDPSCDTHALSGIPYNVFHGSGTGSSDVYGKFCDAIGKDQTKELLLDGGGVQSFILLEKKVLQR